MTALTDLSLREVAERLRRKEVSPVEVTQACLDRIQAVDLNPTAFVLLTADAAMEAAQQAEQEIAVGAVEGRAARRAGGAEGPLRHQGPADHLELQGAGELRGLPTIWPARPPCSGPVR